MTLNSRKTTWIAILSAAGVSLTYVMLVFLPNQRVIRERSEQLRFKQNYVVSNGNVASRIEAAREELHRIEMYNAAWAASIPSEAEIAAVLGELDGLVVASGSTPTRFDPEPAVNMAAMSRVPVVVGCTGEFSQISQFLYSLEQLPQVMWVDRVQIEKSRKDGGFLQCGLDLAVFADNSGESDQVDLAERPIKEETDLQRRLSAAVR